MKGLRMFNKNDDTENSYDDYAEWDLDPMDNEVLDADAELPAVIGDGPLNHEKPETSDGLTVVEFQANVNGFRRGDQAALPHDQADKWVANGMAVKV